MCQLGIGYVPAPNVHSDRGSSPSSVPQKKFPAISIPKKNGVQISNFSSGAPASREPSLATGGASPSSSGSPPSTRIGQLNAPSSESNPAFWVAIQANRPRQHVLYSLGNVLTRAIFVWGCQPSDITCTSANNLVKKLITMTLVAVFVLFATSSLLAASSSIAFLILRSIALSTDVIPCPPIKQGSSPPWRLCQQS